MQRRGKNVFLVVVCLIYSFLALFRLGNLESPQTFYKVAPGEELVILLPEEQILSKVEFFTGTTQKDFKISYQVKKAGACQTLDDGATAINRGSFNPSVNIDVSGPFRWSEIYLKDKTSQIIIKSETNRDISYGEFAVFNVSNKKIDGIRLVKPDDGGVLESSMTIPELTDEQDIVPDKPNMMNSSYFDELYFAQTAYQFAHEEIGYETVHPPLGKILQSVPIFITGKMTPFIWRITGTLVGVLIIIVVFYFAKELFKSETYAKIATILVSLSGLHFVQTRLGTVDSYLCLFTILSFFFMLKFLHQPKKWLFFILSGAAFGCACSVKWSGAFGGIGLAILFIYYFVKNKCYVGFKNAIIPILSGFGCFILLPAAIYFGSYMAFAKTTLAYEPNDVILQGQALYDYHSQDVGTHPFSSEWYTWPLSLKPMLYNTDYANGRAKQIWLTETQSIAYVSVMGILLTFYFAIRYKDKKSLFIAIAWLSLFVPYAFITRIMFLYHYLPASILGIFAIVNIFANFPETRKFIKFYLLFVVINFIIIYPKLSGF